MICEKCGFDHHPLMDCTVELNAACKAAGLPIPFRQFTDFSDEAKDELYDLSNQIFHDAAFAWQLIEQGDPEEAFDALVKIKDRCDEMLAKFEPFRLSTLNPQP